MADRKKNLAAMKRLQARYKQVKKDIEDAENRIKNTTKSLNEDKKKLGRFNNQLKEGKCENCAPKCSKACSGIRQRIRELTRNIEEYTKRIVDDKATINTRTIQKGKIEKRWESVERKVDGDHKLGYQFKF